MPYRLIDISPPITPGLAVWPGDVAFSREFGRDMAHGDNITVSSVRTSLHLGAHADGLNHFLPGAPGIGESSIEPYFGRCQVVEVRSESGARIRPRDITVPMKAPRLLLKTGSYPDPNRFNCDFNSLSTELVEFVAGQGARLIGVDTPSIDPFADKIMESHKETARRRIAILEGLVLDHVEPGFYTLAAFPLRLLDCDASPVRAVLVMET